MIKHSRAAPKWVFKGGQFSATAASKVKSELWTSGQAGGGGLNSMTFTEDDLQKVTCLGAGFDVQELEKNIRSVALCPILVDCQSDVINSDK